MDQVAFGRRLFNARKAKRITSNELAARLGMSASYIRQLECGKRKPSLDMLIAICAELKVSPNFLLMNSVGIESMTEMQQLCMKIKMLPRPKIKLICQMTEMLCGNGEEQP